MGKSQKQVKQVVFSQQAFISPVALLKSVGLHKDKGKADVFVEMEKHLLKTGGLAVYPTHPFKYGYMRIYENKEQLAKEVIGVRSPFTDKQLRTISEFVNVKGLEQCNSDTKYLNRLKSLLTQKCNVQNPDELSWDEILAHISIYLSRTKHSPQKSLLSERQLEVWDLLEGKAWSSKELGQKLGLSEEGIRKHIQAIRKKLGRNALPNTHSRGYWRHDAPPPDFTE